MSFLWKRISVQYLKRIATSTYCRHFTKDTSKGKNKSSSNATGIAKSIKSKFGEQIHQQDKALYTYKTRQKIQSPSGYQHVKHRLKQCNDIHEVMNIMQDYEKCEDVQLGTAAIKRIKILCENKKVFRRIAMDKIEIIWNTMNKYVVGMDSVAYTEYFHACNTIAFDSRCKDKFYEMIDNNIAPHPITLKILLKSCRKSGDTRTAMKYWKTIAQDMNQSVDAECWAAFIAVCATAEKVELAEECFEKCPFKNHLEVCYRMMSVHKNVGNMHKVLEMKNYMDDKKIEMDSRIYNTIADAYRKATQWQQAIDVVQDAISMNKYNAITIKHLFEACVGMIKLTDDFRHRKTILAYIESDVTNYFKQVGDEDRLVSVRHANRMLDAYVATYPSFGSTTFEECCSKYNLQYWEHVNVEQMNIPTLNLFSHNYSMANAILKHIFEKELHVFRELGLNIMISENDNLRYDVVSQKDINVILASLSSTPLIAAKKEVSVLYIPSEQTKQYDPNDDDVLFD
eukprot:293975_1